MGGFRLRGDLMAASDFKLIRPITITDAMVTANNVTETDATEWLAATAFTVGQTCMVTTTANGAATATHAVYTANGSTTGDDPTLATESTPSADWTFTRYTNAWKMFDRSYQSQTINADTIEVEIAPGTMVTSVALLNLEAGIVTVEQTGSGYSETFDLVSHVVTSWWEYFTEVPIRTGDLVVSNIPPYANETLTITIDNTGDDAKCGVLVVGKSKFLGATQWEANRSINDYSIATEAVDGSISLTQGAFSKRLNVEFRVPEGYESEATRILEYYRATPLVFVGSEDYSMSIIYGFLGSWAVPISNTGRNAYAEIKGLV